MKKTYTIFLFLLPIYPLAATQSVCADFGGTGGFLSVNYDTRLGKTNHGFVVRAGVGTLFDQYTFGLTLPVGINYLVGKGKNFFEPGSGASFIYFPEKNQDSWFNFRKQAFLLPYAWLGYRYQPLQKGFTFRAGVSQFFKDLNIPDILVIPFIYPAFSVGYSF